MQKILFFLSVFISVHVSCQENLLDTSYGANNGFTNFTFYTNGAPSGGLEIRDSYKLPDGKILAVGISCLARFTANGILDTAYNQTGYKLFYPAMRYGKIESANDGNFILLTDNKLQKVDKDFNDVPSFTTYSDSGLGNIFIDPTGKIYLIKSKNSTYSIIRLLSNGIQDLTFGNNGEISLGSTYRYGIIKVNSNGDIFVGGVQEIYVNNRRIAVTKIKNDGNIDASFGVGGHFLYPGGEYINVNQLELLDDGKLIGFTAGSICNGNNCTGLIMFRLLPNGTLDLTFKSKGIIVIPLPGIPIPKKLKRFAGNSFIISGSSLRTMYAVRIDSNGDLDNSFGLGGKIITPQLTGEGYPVYNESFELYGNSVVLIGVYSFARGGQLIYAGTARKYFFNTDSLSSLENYLNDVTIYPNPVRENLYLNIKEQLINYEIYDNSNRLLKFSNLIKNPKNILVNDLSSGVYYIKIRTESGISSHRFIKE